jgi:cyclopropane fatty-acyl-phospholipid synthase-like methyltransferase
MVRLRKWLANRQARKGWNVRRLRLALDRIGGPTPRDALELGCGIGAVSAFLANSCRMNVVGTDLDREQIESARQIRSGRGAERLPPRVRLALGGE